MLVARTGGPYSRTESITADELREIPLVLREGGSGTLEVIKAALDARHPHSAAQRGHAAGLDRDRLSSATATPWPSFR
ncbi:MAG: hypothetical protein ACLRMJ_02800 [Alistipes finegoldii]